MHHHKGVQNQKAQEAVLDPAGPANVPFSLAAAAVTSSSSMLPFKQPLQWRISIHARFRGVRLRLRASKMFPGWGGEEARFSVVVRLRSFLLKVRSGSSGSPIVLRRSTTFGSRLLRFVEGALRRRSWPRRFGTDAVAAEENVVLRCPPGSRRFHQLALWPLRKKGVPFPSLESTKSVLGSLAFLSHSASHRNHGGVIVHAAVSFFHLILLSKVALARRPRSPVALAALFITSLGVFSLSYLHFMNQIFEAAWMVCFSLLAFTTLLPLADRCQILLPIGRNFRFSWVFAVFLFLFYKMHPRRSLEVIKMIIDGSTTWIPHLLLIYHSFSHAIGNPMHPRRLMILISLLYFLVVETTMPTFSVVLKHHNAENLYKIMKELQTYLCCS